MRTLKDGAKSAPSMPQIPARDSVPYLVQHLARLMSVEYLSKIESSGLAPAQTYLLRELWVEEPLLQVEIARRLDIGKASVGQTLRRLEEGGFVRRKKDPTDARATYVFLTPKGRDARYLLSFEAEEQVERVRETLGARDTAAFRQALLALVKDYKARLGR